HAKAWPAQSDRLGPVRAPGGTAAQRSMDPPKERRLTPGPFHDASRTCTARTFGQSAGSFLDDERSSGGGGLTRRIGGATHGTEKRRAARSQDVPGESPGWNHQGLSKENHRLHAGQSRGRGLLHREGQGEAHGPVHAREGSGRRNPRERRFFW